MTHLDKILPRLQLMQKLYTDKIEKLFPGGYGVSCNEKYASFSLRNSECLVGGARQDSVAISMFSGKKNEPDTLTVEFWYIGNDANMMRKYKALIEAMPKETKFCLDMSISEKQSSRSVAIKYIDDLLRGSKKSPAADWKKI